MKKAMIATLVLATAASAMAATYRWTDRQGVIHYTDNPNSIPAEYRNKVNKSEDITTRNPKVREELKDQEERARREERNNRPTPSTPDILPTPSPPPQVAPPAPESEELPPGRTKSERVRENRERREGL